MFPRKVGLKAVGLQMAHCPHCLQHHYLRPPYFLGDTPVDTFGPADGLETAPAFAMEVGIIIASTAFIESCIPQLFAKLSGMSTDHAIMTFGAFTSVSQKLQLLEVLRDLHTDSESRTVLKIAIEKFRKCSGLRNTYAHAKYSYSGGDRISIIPYFGDSKKRKEGTSVSLTELRDHAEMICRAKYMIREYLINDTPLKR